MTAPTIEKKLSDELGASIGQVSAAIALLDDGATVPFIARYRKEATGGLDDTQLRLLQTRLNYLRELEERRKTIIDAINAQQKMTPELMAAIEAVEEKTQLEDLYLPYRPKRRTKAKLAAEAGLAALADRLLENPTLDPETEAADFLRTPFETPDGENPGVPDVKAALDGARQVLMERFSEDASLLASVRQYLNRHGVLESKATDGAESKDTDLRFTDYYDYAEPIGRIPSHRMLAILRGRREDILSTRIRLDSETEPPKWSDPHNAIESLIAQKEGIENLGRKADQWLMDSVRWTWRVRILPHMETELMGKLRDQAEDDAILVFAKNLRSLLLAAPAGAKVTMGLDPGIRTGVKVAIVDKTGKVLATDTVYPHQPKNDWQGALRSLSKLVEQYHVELIAIGNGTASRETDRLAKELVRNLKNHKLISVVVSEAGASVYSASEYAAQELPDMDVSLRGAVSIARRLQDPLAELVKIEPKSIGVGQYQHDVAQTRLNHSLDATVEDCVNAVGVDVNTASAPLLARISGLTAGIANNIIRYRNEHGPFPDRKHLMSVPRFGAKTFEQAAGFLRITKGAEPLDSTSVHPEAYSLVQDILKDLKLDIHEILGNTALLKKIRPERYANDQFGIPTVKYILQELEKPGRDPRPEFTYATFKEGIETLDDLKAGMVLEGVITNVTAFGAFVDIGVHQDGLVHISALSDRFVSDPHQIVKTGQLVTVKVLDVDTRRRRIALSMNLNDEPATFLRSQKGTSSASPRQSAKNISPPQPKFNTSLAEAFARVNKGSRLR